MKSIDALFKQEKAFIGYLTAGDGGIKKTLEAALSLIKGGVNMLEIGIPFSDPTADGPTIQRAANRALAAGTSVQDILWLAKEIRKESQIPLILFSYLNPILAALRHNFLRDAKAAGFDGLLLVDCPLEESVMIQAQCQQNELALIYIVTPTTTLERVRKIAQYAQGFLYFACRKGTTGIRDALPNDFEQQIQAIKSVVSLPVVVGFGISTQAMVNQVWRYADGAVVGSFFVKALEDGVPSSSLTKLAHDLIPLR